MSDAVWMDRAVAVARQGLGTTAPNPTVGAVIVRDGVIIGEGCTRPVGGAHAEVMALRAAREAGHDPRGAVMYVTLEPCCHHGRTPPCTDAVIEAGIARVVVGVVDPFPPMRGEGLAILRRAGVEVALGEGSLACSALVRGFTRAITSGLPEVTLKVASSADGHLATASGESQWITGPDARRDGHVLRSQHDAVLVGAGTQRADDPSLTVRAIEGHQPVPVVLDTNLSIAASAKLFTHPRRPVLICADDAPQRDLPADVVRVRRGEGGVDVEAALRALAARGLHRVLVEGGAEVHRALLDARLADTLVVYVAGVLVPGGRSWLGGPPVGSLGAAVRLGRPEIAPVGDDVRLAWRLRHRLEG